LNGGEKVLPMGVSEGLLQVAGKPKFQALLYRIKLHQSIKLDLQFDDDFWHQAKAFGFVLVFYGLGGGGRFFTAWSKSDSSSLSS
jgi:hypothetical protein